MSHLLKSYQTSENALLQSGGTTPSDNPTNLSQRKVDAPGGCRAKAWWIQWRRELQQRCKRDPSAYASPRMSKKRIVCEGLWISPCDNADPLSLPIMQRSKVNWHVTPGHRPLRALWGSRKTVLID